MSDDADMLKRLEQNRAAAERARVELAAMRDPELVRMPFDELLALAKDPFRNAACNPIGEMMDRVLDRAWGNLDQDLGGYTNAEIAALVEAEVRRSTNRLDS
jgi:hypothetical protein